MADMATALSPETLDALGVYESLSQGDVKVTRLPKSRCSGLYRIDFMGTMDDEYCSLHVRIVPDALAVMEAIELPTTFTMPNSISGRLTQLNVAARDCYALRNASQGELANDYEEIGDVFLSRSHALLAEWEA